VTDEEVKARIGIADRLAAASQAGDARKADAYAACFAEDGVLDLSRGGGAALRGREAIRAWMNAPSVIAQDPGRPMGFISHHLTTCKIDLSGADAATARTYWLVTSHVGVDHNGYYDDFLRLIDGIWLLASRKPRTLRAAADSLTRRNA
jgi:hypothetical protein